MIKISETKQECLRELTEEEKLNRLIDSLTKCDAQINSTKVALFSFKLAK
jgi:hypothetical protein